MKLASNERETSGHNEGGFVLLLVLMLFFVLYASTTSFMWFMNRLQTNSGVRHRDLAALNAAEAGIQRVLAALESERSWRPHEYTESLQMGPLAGRFTVSVETNGDDSLKVTSEGVVGGRTRRLEARVTLASPALLAALYGSSAIQFEGPAARVIIVPYDSALASQRWAHVAAGEAIRFVDVASSILDAPAGSDLPAGPLVGLDHRAGGCASNESQPARLVLPREGELTVGRSLQTVESQQLRVAGYRVEDHRTDNEGFPSPPRIDRDFYVSLAVANTANADINRLAGGLANNLNLSQKKHSLYEPGEMVDIMRYGASRRSGTILRGVVFVTGGLALGDGARLTIADGALVTERTIFLGEKAALTITHTPSTRTLPGVLMLDQGGLVLEQRATLKAHGLVYVSRSLEMGEGAVVELVGALLARDPMLAVRSDGGRMVICYDQAVLGTPGLTVAPDKPIIAWVSDWKESGR